MADNKNLDIEKQEAAMPEGTERTRPTACFIPRADIYEDEGQMVIVADIPGVDENSVDITLEKNILTINAYVESPVPEGYALAFSEYEVGDYQRSFKLSDEIDREKIKATVKDGQLRLFLPKAAELAARKISVSAG